MGHTLGTEVAREDRYAFARNKPVSIMVEPRELCQQGQVFRARLLDLSPHGAKLSVSADLAIRKALRLELSIDEFPVVFYVSAEICWSKPISTNEWHVGCILKPAVPTVVFDWFARDGRLDRRSTLRCEDTPELPGYAELADGGEPVTLRNYSQGGCCVSSSKLGKPGDRIQIFVEAPEQAMIVAVVQWRLEMRDGCLLGCTFLDETDFARLRAACELRTTVL